MEGGTGFGSQFNPVNLFCDLRTANPCASGLRPARILYDYWASLRISLTSPGATSPFGEVSPSSDPLSPYAESRSLIRYAADRYATSLTSDADFLKASPRPRTRASRTWSSGPG